STRCFARRKFARSWRRSSEDTDVAGTPDKLPCADVPACDALCATRAHAAKQKCRWAQRRSARPGLEMLQPVIGHRNRQPDCRRAMSTVDNASNLLPDLRSEEHTSELQSPYD